MNQASKVQLHIHQMISPIKRKIPAELQMAACVRNQSCYGALTDQCPQYPKLEHQTISNYWVVITIGHEHLQLELSNEANQTSEKQLSNHHARK